MVSSAERWRGSGGLVLAAAVLALVAGPVAAQTAPPAKPSPPPAAKPPPPSDDDEDDSPPVPTVTVRAHKIIPQPGAVVGDIKPELQLSPADVQSFGVSTVTELLEELAPETRSDRGRGGEAPVILLNGRRISGMGEIANIPTEAILRVDILPEEVALKYGYTANQRVVNIVLRRRFRSTTGEATGGQATEGGDQNGAAEYDLLHLRGDARLNIDLKYNANAGLRESDRDLTSIASTEPYALTGNVLSATSGGEIDPALSALVGHPVTVAGVPASAATGAPSLADFGPTAGLANTTNVGDDRSLAPVTQQFSANAVMARPTIAGIRATVNATFTAATSQSLQGLPGVSLLLPAGDPFSPFGSNVLVDRYVPGFGPLRQTSNSWTAHLSSTLNRDVGDWRLSLTDGYDHGDSQTNSDSGVDIGGPQALLNGDSPTFNPFAPLPGALLTRLPQTTARSISDAANIQVLANGPLLTLPAGDLYVSFKLGDTQSWQDSNSQRMGLSQSMDLAINDADARLNVDIPLTSRTHHILSPLGELSINGNIAADQLSTFGLLKTLGYGVNWTPVTGLSLIVSQTTDHAAPSAAQLVGPLVATPNTLVFDYATGKTADVTQITGGNDKLTADTRNVIKVGLTLKPIASQNLTITANFIKSRIDNPIATFPAADAAIEAAFPSRFIHDAAGDLTEEDIRPVNFARQDREEVRWGVVYSRPIGPQPQARFDRRAFAGQRRRQGRGQGQGPPAPDSAVPGGPAAPPPAADGQPPAPPADGPPDGGGGGGPRGGGGGGGRGGFGGGRGGFGAADAGGRLQFAIYHTVILTDRILVAPGGPMLDLLNGSPASSTGGQPRQEIEAQAAISLNGYGARLSADWKSGTTVVGGAGGAAQDLTFSDIGTINVRLFDNLGQQRATVRRYPWLRGARLTLNVNNLFDQRLRVRNAVGATPLNYQGPYLDPTGRTISLSFRKLFY